MKTPSLEQLKYPIGQANIPNTISEQQITAWINILEEFPAQLSMLVTDLNDDQLNTPYREGGWTVRQVIHHLSDSHHHSYIRFKWTLTENEPTIKAYFEQRWADLHDGKAAPISLSLNALAATHAKLVYFLKGISNDDLQQHFIHPETNAKVKLATNIGIYAWHSQHHYAHIKNLMLRKKWL